MEAKRISVPLSPNEWEALCEMARKEYRHPKLQARYLLSAALGVTDEGKHNGAATTLAGTNGAAVSLPG